MIDLRDDSALLSEALAEHSDGPTDRPGCYALNIATPDANYQTHARRWVRAGYQSPPPYLATIVKADALVYVGRSGNVRGRIEDHLNTDKRQATLPTVYDVRSIRGVRWGDNSDHAERQYADELRRETDAATFVHTR